MNQQTNSKSTKITRKRPKTVSFIAGTVIAAISASCSASNPELLEYHSIEENALGRTKTYALLRAPEMSYTSDNEVPVVLFLHGMGDEEKVFDRYEVSSYLHKRMSDGSIPPAHFIIPDGEQGFYLNWYDGSRRYEDYIINDVLPEAERVLGVSPNRENRHIMGVSMGGFGALNLGLAYPDLFSSISSFSSFVLDQETGKEFLSSFWVRFMMRTKRMWGDGSDEAFLERYNPFFMVDRLPEENDMRFYMISGTEEMEEMHQTMDSFHQVLLDKGYDSEYHQYEGAHGWKWWTPEVAAALEWQLEETKEESEAG